MLLTEMQAAREVQVDRRTIRRLIRDGRLRALDFGSGKRHRYRIDPVDLRALGTQRERDHSPLTTPPSPAASRRRRRPAAISLSASAYLPSA
jgi:excisionase family DNA binding protein